MNKNSIRGKVKAVHYIVEHATDNAVLLILFSILGGIISTAICKAFGW